MCPQSSGVPPAPTPSLIRQQQEDTGREEGQAASRSSVVLTSLLLDLALEMAGLSLWLVTAPPRSLPRCLSFSSEMRQPGGVVASKGTSSHTSLSAELGSDGSHIHTRM